MRPEFDVRSYEPGDEAHIVGLFQQCFGRDLTETRWRWRYRANPTGPGVIGLAWHGDVLVAHYGASLVDLRVHGRDWQGGLVGGLMVHPDYRGYGLIAKSGRMTHARMAELGMPVAWGFPNSLSHRRVVKDLSFVDMHEVPMFRLSMEAVAALPIPSGNIVELEGFDRRFDNLWKQVRDDYPVITRRDRERLQWRYVRNPSERYRILAFVDGEDMLGYVVFKRYRQELQAIDILTVRDVEVGMQLISQMAQVARGESASALSLWLNMSHPLHWALEELGFGNGEPITYFTARILRPELPQDVAYDYRNWYLTMGDSDVF